MIKESVAVVTGASSGIGRETAKLLISKGYRVYGLSRTAPKDECILHIKADVTSEEETASAFQKVFEETGRIDAVVSNAGMGISGPIESTSSEDAHRQMEVNFFGFYNVVRAAVPYMRERGGSIVATSSVAAVFAIPFQGFYSASKFAINALVLALRNELAPFKIKVSAVMPGDVRTGFTDKRKKPDDSTHYGASVEKSVSVMEHDEKNGMSPERIARKLVKNIEAKSPKPLSTVGMQYKLYCFLGKALPIRAQNYIVGKMYIK